MNKLSLVQTYYNEPDLLQKCIDRWNNFSADLHIILIDDGSKTYPAIDIISQNKIRDNIKFSLYAVDEDIGFNSHGCRNLGAQVAETQWIIFLDIDYTIQPGDMSKLVNEYNLISPWYNFQARYYKTPNNTYTPLNQFLIQKDFYLKSGGYDESYTNWHYGDRQFLDKLTQLSPPDLLEMTITCHRGARKTIINNDLSGPIYDNENMIMYSPRLDYFKIKQIDTKINFNWTKLL